MNDDIPAFDMKLLTQRVTFVATLPPELDIMEREATFIYVLRPAAPGVVEVIGYQLAGRVVVEPHAGSNAYAIVKDLCDGHWLTEEKRKHS